MELIASCILDSAYNPMASAEIRAAVEYQVAKIIAMKTSNFEVQYYDRSDPATLMTETLDAAYQEGARLFIGAHDPFEAQQITEWFRSHRDAIWLCLTSNVTVLPPDYNIKMLVSEISDLLEMAKLFTDDYINITIVSWEPVGISSDSNDLSTYKQKHKQKNSTNTNSNSNSNSELPTTVAQPLKPFRAPAPKTQQQRLLQIREEEDVALQFWNSLKSENIEEVLYLLHTQTESAIAAYMRAFHKVFPQPSADISGKPSPKLVLVGYSPALRLDSVLAPMSASAQTFFVDNHPSYSLFWAATAAVDAVYKIEWDVRSRGKISEDALYLRKVYTAIGKLEIDKVTNKPIERDGYVHALRKTGKSYISYRENRVGHPLYGLSESVDLNPLSFFAYLHSHFIEPLKQDYSPAAETAMASLIENARRLTEQKDMVNIYTKASVLASDYNHLSFNSRAKLTQRANTLFEQSKQLSIAATRVSGF